jgi:hypothetical protein
MEIIEILLYLIINFGLWLIIYNVGYIRGKNK